MATNLLELGNKFQDLAADSLQDQVRAAQRYNQLIQKFGRGELLKQQVGDAYLRFIVEETAQFVGNLTSLSLNYYKGLLELGRTYNERFFEQVVEGTRPTRAATSSSWTHDAPAAVSHRRVEIELSGAVGQEASRSFVLESKRAEAAEISFLVSDFVEPQRSTPFRANLEFQPARFILRPGEERVVTIRLPLSPELFLPGVRYTATAVVRGYDDLELSLSVTPAAPAATAAQDIQPPAPAGTSS